MVETGLSDFHLITVTVMRETFNKICPRLIVYRFYRYFFNEIFRASLIYFFSNEVFINNSGGLEKFCKATMDSLNSFTLIKKKYARGN